jgi:hypothetical protein
VFLADPEVADPEEGDRAPLLSHGYENSSYRVPEPFLSVEIQPARSLSRGHDGSDGLPNIYGKQLWFTPDFYLIVAIMAICEHFTILDFFCSSMKLSLFRR